MISATELSRAAHGLARLWSSGLWPYPTSKSVFLDRIDGMIEAASKLTRRDGSLEEAFPHEGSYCVTALVAFDLLCALDLLDEVITPERRERWEECIRPMLGYLIEPARLRSDLESSRNSCGCTSSLAPTDWLNSS